MTGARIQQMGLLVFIGISSGQYALALWLRQIRRGFSGSSTFQVGFVSAKPNCRAPCPACSLLFS
jgi:hypothetical protein